MSALRRTGLFFAALPFRSKLYRCGGWPTITAVDDPIPHYSSFLRRFFTRQEMMTAIDRADRYCDTSADRDAVSVLLNSDDRYPPLLKKIFDPPPVLFVKGPLFQRAAYLAVVGTRYPDRITIDAVDRFADRIADLPSLAALSANCFQESVPQPQLFAPSRAAQDEGPVVTVSGFAFGVDERIHRASIYRQIPTVAVLGSGLDLITPVSNQYLIDEAYEMKSELSFVSEFFPDETPRRFAYPRRNRIIAGMSPICVVFQAGPRSGALITARFAMDEGRDVVAFDHPDLVGVGKNEGARGLLADGAGRLVLFAA